MSRPSVSARSTHRARTTPAASSLGYVVSAAGSTQRVFRSRSSAVMAAARSSARSDRSRRRAVLVDRTKPAGSVLLLQDDDTPHLAIICRSTDNSRWHRASAGLSRSRCCVRAMSDRCAYEAISSVSTAASSTRSHCTSATRSRSSEAEVSRRRSVKVARIWCTASARSASSPWPRLTDAAATLDIREPATRRFIRRG